MKKRFLSLLLCAVTTLSLCSCAGKSYRQEIFAMDTYMSLVVYGNEEALDESVREINKMESLFSKTQEDSEIYQLNKTGSIEASQDTLSIISDCLSYASRCQGAFDPTISPLVDAWNIHEDGANILTEEEIASYLPYVGMQHIHLDGNTITLDEGTQIDLGGVAKGFASDRVAQILEGYDVENAAISLGGNVYVKGINPQKKQPWNVAIQDPDGDSYACMLSLSDCFAVTSGGYQRYYEDENGHRYIHILDPKTGKPVDNDLLSVSIIGKSGTICDIFSTALFVLGSEKAMALYKDSPLFDMILITKDHTVYYSSSLQDVLQQESEDYVFTCIS